MIRAMFALVAILYASSLFAGEEIYLYTSYNDSEGAHISHKMKCREGMCEINSNAARQSVPLTETQRDQILGAFQAEVKRFDVRSAPEPGDELIKIKFKYSTGRKRLGITHRVPVGQFSDVTPELIAVFETFLPGLDFSSLNSAESATNDEETAAPAR